MSGEICLIFLLFSLIEQALRFAHLIAKSQVILWVHTYFSCHDVELVVCLMGREPVEELNIA